MAPDGSALYKSMHKTTTDFIGGYCSAAKETDPTLLSTTLSPTCKRFFRPKWVLPSVGLGIDGLSNVDYETRMSGELALLESVRVEYESLVIDETERSAVTVTDHYLRLKGQQEEACLEFVHALTFNEAGDKIEKVVEFFDSAGALKFIETMMAVAKKQ